ncbi:MAG TPA: O-antigen ligase family protein [Thermoleophilaceae bacterium]|nr:O-antigen ligase family protein [Thermoleophilaceae bacterium]
MNGALAVAQIVREAGIVAAALATAGAFVLRDPRLRAGSLVVALALVPVLLLGELWDSEQIEPLRDRPAVALAAAAAGLAVVCALATALTRRPAAFPLLVVAALPFRVPVEVGGDSANLLVPLYLVIGAGGVAYAWTRMRGDGEHERQASRAELALLAAVVLYAVQAAYSEDFEQALENVVFFYVPFALLLRLLVEVEWTRRLVLACLGLAASLAVVFAGIGFWEYGTRHLLWNPKVVASNQFESYFRVNSLFFDPNIYGRFLAIVMIGLAALMLWARERRTVLGVALVLAVLWAGLVLTFSQSSFAALLTGLAVLAALRWGLRPVLAVAGAAAAAVLVVLVAAPGALDVDLGSQRSLDDATSGRASLMRGGVEMFADRPLGGFGSGSFAGVFREREEVSSEQAASASHTIPITVAAEQGLPGLAAYLAVLAAAATALFGGLSGLRPLRSRRARPESERGPPAELVARGAVAAAYTALVLHTLLYAAFLEDPLSWTLIGIGIGLSATAPSSARTRTGSNSP